ncbi:enoyl-CoA hydratase [Mesorhizobium sp. 2RAF21]|uniref:enoyl-CoA hydratase n=1 Tax=Mesorhizobium sp. 2RAF21 TaxID=3232995 RepID=UPI003F973378
MAPTIEIERRNRVVLVTLNRPAALNALSSDIMHEIVDQLVPLDRDSDVGCFVVAGSAKAFAAGADIQEMSEATYIDMLMRDHFAGWNAFADLRTPKIAAVSGFALGGGCELAMMCDLIIAAESARFGQPEIKLGVIPGMGGSQRLTKAIGKAKAMDLILTGRTMDAVEAERCGLVSRIVPDALLLDTALEVAATIASYSKPSVVLARECVGRALESSLHDGLLFERRVFHSLFATRDQKEGMAAFIEKRTPDFEGA